MTKFTARCGRKTNSRGRPFGTREALADHSVACDTCKFLEARKRGLIPPGYFDPRLDWTEELDKRLAEAIAADAPELELTRAIADDEPDGVFWAIAHEMGEIY